MVEQQNKVAFLTSAKVFEFKSIDIPVPKDDEVLIQPATIGICGSDVHYWKHLRCGPFIIDFQKDGPLILGHESSAVVKSVGKNVTHLKPGDKICIEPGIPCRECDICISGKYNLCKKMAFHATPPYNGTFQKYMTHLASFCFKLDKVTLDEAALIEPLSVAVHACQRGGVGVGSHLLITGAGPIGVVCVKVGRASGATRIIVCDIDDKRLEFAKQTGADVTINTGKLSEQEVLQILEAEEISHSFECSGVDSAISLCIKGSQPGGKILTIGRGGKDNQSLPLHLASDKEVDILGSFRYRGAYKKGLELLESGVVKINDMITHQFEFEEIQKAFETTENAGQTGAMKVIIRVNKF